MFVVVVYQIGLRCDSAIASVYDETGQEVENAELLFTEEGKTNLFLAIVSSLSFH